MRYPPRLLLAAALVAVFLCPTPAAGDTEPTRADQWRTIAQRALDRYTAIQGSTTQQAMALSYAAQSSAWLSADGWQDPVAQAYLQRLYMLRNPDGGWGLGAAYDAHQDGSINASSTTYVVTLAGHVGPTLLDAWRAGIVPRADVQTVVDLIVTAPRIDTTTGRCVAYSRAAADAKTGLCVHNVSAGAGAFLFQAGQAGFAPAWWLIAGIAKRTASAYNLTTRMTPYKDATAPTSDDPDHASYTAESMLWLDPAIGYVAAYYLAVNDFDHPQTPIAHMRLTGAPDVPGGTPWCELGDRWLTEADAYITTSANDPVRLSQIAYYGARNARVCA
ncbi:hypothetical protein [Actinoplanes regularis]|uniref:hypothetical protein n=1 Tax=Actinoplanes regularis TaxID=52697 RepID=UPI0024A38694|nr:hypothetical protein [Actinoplanes regularis]GLW32281.1 hypothetical protein Areg01_52200 [Actinoplanes regularis]